MAYPLTLLAIGRVDDEEAALYVSHHHLGPHSDALVGIQGDGEPLLSPGPDPARVVLPADLPRDEGGVPHHSLDPVEHIHSLFLLSDLHLFNDLHPFTGLHPFSGLLGDLHLLSGRCRWAVASP
jgi:hypothetical protein